jgi:hypothetical protein
VAGDKGDAISVPHTHETWKEQAGNSRMTEGLSDLVYGEIAFANIDII